MNTKLNVKQWAIATAAVFVVSTIFGYVPRKLEIGPWMPSAQTMAQDEMTMRVLFYLARLFAAGFFTFIFTKGFEGKPGIGEGLRYGLWISLFLYVPWLLTGFAFGEWTASALFIRAIIGVMEALVGGAVVAQLYKPSKA
ncbi:MAG: hypothetical protein HW412_710 [Bacteroidetes bacterium]|nr:hypothetical protein [Bacteroidota bacterium]